MSWTKSINIWLWRPFDRIAGLEAMAAGAAAIIIAAVLGYFSHLHFDGIIDVHMGAEMPFTYYILQHLLMWILMAVVLTLTGFVMSKASFRVIDIFGTQALARWPMLIVSIAGLPVASEEIDQFMKYHFLGEGGEIYLSAADWFFFILFSLITLVCIIWMIVLMYRGYSISCNIKGTRAVISFLVALLVAEIVSKILLNQIINFYNV